MDEFEQRMEAQGSMQFLYPTKDDRLMYLVDLGFEKGLCIFSTQQAADDFASVNRLVVINDPGQSTL